MNVKQYTDGEPYTIKHFVVDRIAIGIPIEDALAQLESLEGVRIKEPEFIKMFPDYSDEVEQRRLELEKILRSHRLDIVDRVNSLSNNLEEVVSTLTKSQKFKTMAPVAAQLIRSLELLAKSVGAINTAPVQNINILSIGEDYYRDLVGLQEMGLIKIVDSNGLKKAYGLIKGSEEVVIDVNESVETE